MPSTPFQPEYMPLLFDTVHELRQQMEGALQGIYLSGSVMRRSAVPNRSNLNITLLFSAAVSVRHHIALDELRHHLRQRHPIVTHIDFQTVTLGDVGDLTNIFRWGFWFKHCCICLYGDDIGDEFGDFEPSWDVAKAFNGDVAAQLAAETTIISSATTVGPYIESCDRIARKLLFTAAGLTIHRDKLWAYSLEQAAEQFLFRYPEKYVEVERLLILSARKRVPKRAVLALLSDFGEWVVKAFQKIDRKIG